MQLIKSGTKIDFVGWRYPAAITSLILVIISWIAFFAVAPNWGIDFTGGTEIRLQFEDEVPIQEVRSALTQLGLSDDAVQQIGEDSDHEFIVRIQDPEFGSAELQADVESRLREAYGASWLQNITFDAEVGARFTVDYTGEEVMAQGVATLFEDLGGVTVQPGMEERQFVIRVPGLSEQIKKAIEVALQDRPFEVMAVDAVGPKVGAELARQGFISVAATLGLVLIYVAFRFDLSFAPGAILALFHDVTITMGIFVLLQKEFNLPMIGALLTIVGYSLNDTIVIYDRIRENLDRYRRAELAECINVSINETLRRTLSTSITTLLAISAFLFMGGPVIQDFAFAMLLGIVFGTYSTVFVASPMILVMEDVKPHLSSLVATPEMGDASTGEEGDEDELTEAEKRRRERKTKV